MLCKRRVGGVRQSGPQCGCSTNGGTTQESAAVQGAFDHSALVHFSSADLATVADPQAWFVS
ncbi:hypothetical protein CKO51_18550 [Rhodopirellula sp. SM50]|nr:hypothetical protein CKO51_18550 [Rhodopirellula sp. SM50]